MLGYWLPPTPWAQNSARLRLANSRFVENSLIYAMLYNPTYNVFCYACQWWR